MILLYSIITELIGWILIICFLAARYWFNKKRLSVFIFLLIVINEVWLLPYGLYRIRTHGTSNFLYTYEVVEGAVALLGLGILFKYVDTYAQKLVVRMKRISKEMSVGFFKSLFSAIKEQTLENRERARLEKEQKRQQREARLAMKMVPDRAHAKKLRKEWYEHVCVFLLVILFLLLINAVGVFEFISSSSFKVTREDIYQQIGGIFRVWGTIVIIDFLISFFYTIWPKKVPLDASKDVASS